MPNLRVDSVSSNYWTVGLMHRIMTVLELPPNDDLSILVSDEFLYGTWLHYYIMNIYGASSAFM